MQVQADDPRMSRWALSTVQFGQTLEFAWLARDLTPITNQKARLRCTARNAAWRCCGAHAPGTPQIHWVSQGGLPNRGAVTFYPRPDGCALQLAISYELPPVLQAVGEGVRPVVESILRAGTRPSLVMKPTTLTRVRRHGALRGAGAAARQGQGGGPVTRRV